MHIDVQLMNRPVHVEASRRAAAELERRDRPLRVEMELYFSCMIGKKLRFDDEVQGGEFTPVGSNLEIGFRAVQTKACHVSADTGKPGRVAFPIRESGRFVPKWLSLDFREGRFTGEFGFCVEDAEVMA